MKFKTIPSEVEIRHDNGHLIGRIEYDPIWKKWILRTKSAGLDADDVKKIWKLMRRLRR